MQGIEFYKAAIAHYNSERQEALAVLQLYLANPSAVAQHSDIMSDIKARVEEIAHADLCLSVLQNYVKSTPEPGEVGGQNE